MMLLWINPGIFHRLVRHSYSYARRAADWTLVQINRYARFLQKHNICVDNATTSHDSLRELTRYLEDLEAILGDFYEFIDERERRAYWQNRILELPLITLAAAGLLISNTLQIALKNAEYNSLNTINQLRDETDV